MKEPKILIDTADALAIRYGLVLCVYNARSKKIMVSAFNSHWLDIEVALATFKDTLKERGLNYE